MVIGRKNRLFAGPDTGAETLARPMTIIETAKLNCLDPQAYLASLRPFSAFGGATGASDRCATDCKSLDRIRDHKINRLDELLPWNWKPTASALRAVAA